jgi:MoaA/NifB/PqqE/SkfB family radical SAM enzyme
VAGPVSRGRAAIHIKPTIATVYITKFCNSRCTMCDFWQADRDPSELTAEQWGVIFSRLKAFGVEYIGVNASGELFTRRDAYKILQHIKDLDMSFGVNSNATLFTSSKAKKLAALGPKAVTIGLEGVGNDMYLATRGLKNGFNKISRSINNLKEAGITNIGIGTVMMRENIDHWVKLAEWARDEGIGGVRFTAQHDAYFNPVSDPKMSSYADPDFIARVDEQIEQLIAFKKEHGIVRNSEKYLRQVGAFYKDQMSFFPTPCLQGGNRIELDVFGNVTLCSFVTESLGNLLIEDMESIWNSEKHRQAREDAYSGDCPRCYLSCYAEENLRLSPGGFLPTMGNSLARMKRLVID